MPRACPKSTRRTSFPLAHFEAGMRRCDVKHTTSNVHLGVVARLTSGAGRAAQARRRGLVVEARDRLVLIGTVRRRTDTPLPDHLVRPFALLQRPWFAHAWALHAQHR